ncbi:hypothetical protein CspeluHIS016_0204880 [Cutaneotrichosporon spelunceum]|uniref:Uncharacterized protein n=1 Tax=Cutaneotrichosporon spelunceum TaxID=1672016 RepID=A0AAD3YB19_9TREE|nr:hypothetical protein CspeluHIS016_0204880 [Cutaneotrichosporon spelunceum]
MSDGDDVDMSTPTPPGSPPRAPTPTHVGRHAPYPPPTLALSPPTPALSPPTPQALGRSLTRVSVSERRRRRDDDDDERRRRTPNLAPTPATPLSPLFFESHCPPLLSGPLLPPPSPPLPARPSSPKGRVTDHPAGPSPDSDHGAPIDERSTPPRAHSAHSLSHALSEAEARTARLSHDLAVSEARADRAERRSDRVAKDFEWYAQKLEAERNQWAYEKAQFLATHERLEAENRGLRERFGLGVPREPRSARGIVMTSPNDPDGWVRPVPTGVGRRFKSAAEADAYDALAREPRSTATVASTAARHVATDRS